jgi:hypothetical protein
MEFFFYHNEMGSIWKVMGENSGNSLLPSDFAFLRGSKPLGIQA